MNFRSTYILLGVVVAALFGLGIYVATRSGDKDTSPAVEGYVLKQLRAANITQEKITSVEIERPGQTPEKMAFVRDGRSWQMVVPAKVRTDSNAVDAIVAALLNAKTVKSADVAGSLGTYGLDNSPVKVTLKGGDLSESLSIGNVTIGGNDALAYVATSDKPDRPQAARRSDFMALFKKDATKSGAHASQMVKGVTEFRPLKLIGDGLVDPVNQVRSMSVRAGKDEMALYREPPGNNWKFRVPADYGEVAIEGPDPVAGAKDPTGIGNISQLLNTITNIQPAGREQIVEGVVDLGQYGLDPVKNAPLQIDFTRDDGSGETIFVSGPIKAKEEGKPDKYYARNNADGAVAEVPAEPVQKVLAALGSKNLLRDRTVLRVMPVRVDAIDIITNGETVELRRVGPTWQVYDAEGKPRPARPAAVMELVNRLVARQLAPSFPPPGEPDNKIGFSPVTTEVKVWEGGILREEKKDEKVDPNAKPKLAPQPTARVIFGHKAIGDVYYARRITGAPPAEQKADFFLPMDVYTLVTRTRLDYVDPSMKPLSADAILKLSFTHGKDVFELERADDGKPAPLAAWKINAPERLKGRAADPGKVADLITQLAIMHATRVAADKVTTDVLNRLEVNGDAARMRVTANIKGQGDRVFFFGGDVGTEKRNVYLKPADQELVYEVDRSAFDAFQKADVQDTVVQRIDKTKIKAVKITGWQEVLGTPETLELERKEGKWTLKSGGMYELDPVKVEAFLNELTTPRAEAFVVLKEGPKPEHNLDVAKNALAIEMILETGDPVKMVIAAPNKEGKVFATTSALPGDVFTLVDRFAGIRAKKAAFKKD
ncbi:MAG TPA: DUF4340 domain-containing protein [Gemmataceae bacterium]|jgi:hypothetical protein|nr:DUF4340 domain-containing protein [Gemmataceae bacterium]